MYLIMDNGRPHAVSMMASQARHVAAEFARIPGSVWGKGEFKPEADKLWTVSSNGCPLWTGWEILPIEVL